LITGAAAFAAVAVLAVWTKLEPPKPIAQRVPGADHVLAPQPEKDHVTPLVGTLQAGSGVPGSAKGNWPSFRGERRTGVSEEKNIARGWGRGGPPVLWSVDVGEGYAGCAIHSGCVYILDYDREAQRDALRCLSLEDGREIWRHSYPVKVKRNHGMSRTTPAVSNGFIVSLGPKCHFLCVDSTTGEFLWLRDLVSEFGATVPPWYSGQCPLIEDGRAIVALGGDGLMAAIDCETGKIVWTTPNPRGWRMTHSSITPMMLGDRRTYVYCASGGVVGIDSRDGKILWEYAEWKIDIATIPSPVVVSDRRIFLSGGYDAGAMMLQLVDSPQGIEPKALYRLPPKVFGATQHTPILFKEFLYGVRPDGQLTCLNLDGTVRWTSGMDSRFGLGPFLIADDVIFAMNDEGELTVADATPTKFRRLDHADVLSGHESWAPMAIAGGRLMVRDFTQLACLDVVDHSR
jgi:outer membrane protein assembly factor BamB